MPETTLRPLWTDSADIPRFERLQEAIQTDVLVVGAGIAGLTAATLLQEAGRSVTLLEARHIGAGETGATTAHLTEMFDTRYHVLESKFGAGGARLAAESARAAINHMEAVAAQAGAGCELERVPGYLYAETEPQREELKRELESFRRVGMIATWVNELPFPARITGAVRFEQQAQVHPLQYLSALVQRFVAAGGRIFEDTQLLDVDDGAPCRASTSGGAVTANEVLVLTHVPVSNKFAIHTKIAAYRSYVVAARLASPFPPGQFSDMQEPYHYTRGHTTAGGSFLVVGGADHKTGQNSDARRVFEELAAYATHQFGATDIAYRWSGQIIEPADGLPFIGKNPGAQHVHVATGFSGTGMTNGTLAGMILSDAVVGRTNPWAELYAATRVKPLAQVREYVAENVDFPTHLVRDLFSRNDPPRLGRIAAGEGRLIRSRGKTLAVYRDGSGMLHARNATCTHLGCRVQWNNAEKSWDCPCHGSRFDVDGAVLNGPATEALAPASLEELETDVERPRSVS